MKTITSLTVLLPLLALPLWAQDAGPASPAAPIATSVVPVQTAPVQAQFTAEQLDQMLAPIALYPDALIALLLPASTNPSDIVLAARFLQSGGLPSQADLQPWDDSVRGLAHYPQLIRWMDENLAWTKQIGEAFGAQPTDVMNTIQRLRARAKAAGVLASTPQQQVVVQDNSILIVPADPNVIYVPYYDPAIVFGPEPAYYPYSSATYFSFSSGFATGWWLAYGLDWPHRHVWVVNHHDRERYWRDHERDWTRHVGPPPEHHREVHVWQPHRDFRPRPFTPRPVVAPGPTFDHRRDFPRGDDRRSGPPRTDQWRDSGGHSSRPGTPATALATPRTIPNTATTAPAPVTTVPPAFAPSGGQRHRNFEPREHNFRPEPADQARRTIRGPDTRPTFRANPTPVPDTRAPVVNTRPVITDTRPAPTYQPRPYVPPGMSTTPVAPMPAPQPRFNPPAHHAAPPAYTPPPAPAPQPSSNQDQSQGGGRGESGHRPFVRH